MTLNLTETLGLCGAPIYEILHCPQFFTGCHLHLKVPLPLQVSSNFFLTILLFQQEKNSM